MAKIFKPYPQGQTTLFPSSLSEKIEVNHPVRVVNSVIDRLDLSCLLEQYSSSGASSYHPRMLLKVLVYGYLTNTYSSRKLEAQLKCNIHFMWLSGSLEPDHNTINRFRSDKLKGHIQDIFSEVVQLLVASGHVSLKRVFTDGTKIESRANRYTFVWGRAIKRSRERIAEQLEELWNYAEQVASEELKDQRPTTFEAIDPHEVEQAISTINGAIGKKKVPTKVKQKLNYARKTWPDKVKEYNEKEQILGERNSYSKTDPDATFMRMKEDYMKNGQLKPGYNLQISTSNQYILHYSLHHNPTDTQTLIPHLEGFEKAYNTLPEELTADAGYGSEENYLYLKQKGIDSYVKYNTFDITKKRAKWKDKYPFHVSNLHYNLDKDQFTCPMGQSMDYIGSVERKNRSGFIQTQRRYQVKRCTDCPLRGKCHKGKTDRIIEVNFQANQLREESRRRLESERGIENRKRRPVDVEPVFGHLKYNRGFKRFMLRRLKKVEIEMGLLALAHNLRKIAG